MRLLSSCRVFKRWKNVKRLKTKLRPGMHLVELGDQGGLTLSRKCSFHTTISNSEQQNVMKVEVCVLHLHVLPRLVSCGPLFSSCINHTLNLVKVRCVSFLPVPAYIFCRCRSTCRTLLWSEAGSQRNVFCEKCSVVQMQRCAVILSPHSKAQTCDMLWEHVICNWGQIKGVILFQCAKLVDMEATNNTTDRDRVHGNATTTAQTREMGSHSIVLVLQCIVGAVGIFSNAAVIVVFSAGRKYRRKIAVKFILNQVSGTKNHILNHHFPGKLLHARWVLHFVFLCPGNIWQFRVTGCFVQYLLAFAWVDLPCQCVFITQCIILVCRV